MSVNFTSLPKMFSFAFASLLLFVCSEAMVDGYWLLGHPRRDVKLLLVPSERHDVGFGLLI